MWKKDLKTLVLLLLTMLVWAVVYNMLTSCTKTTQKLVTTHDTVYVAHSLIDSTYESNSAHEKDFTSKTDTIIKTDIRHDTITLRDSVYVREKGDSLYIYKEKWRTKIDIRHDTILKVKTDTLYRTRTDTLTIIRYTDRTDSAYTASHNSQKQVRQRRTFPWWSVPLSLLVLFAVIRIIRSKAH